MDLVNKHQRRHLPLLLSVRIVAREVPTLAPLFYIQESISDFLDYALPKHWSVLRACERVCKPGEELHISTSHHAIDLLARVAHWDTAVLDLYYKSHLFNKALVLAVEAESLAVVNILSAWNPDGLAVCGMNEAARRGHLEILKWLAANHRNLVWTPTFVKSAALSGRIETMQWLTQYVPEDRLVSVLEAATRTGQLEATQWLYIQF